ncbi:MAG: ABC transporter substrate-binding protein, partial [Thermomicrobiaceae bacterium]|nr:ABC transporter substrate-binding protein [Thermomicrobiaceae bacterium]
MRQIGARPRPGVGGAALRALLVALIALALAACGRAGSAQKTMTIGLTYVPNIQFAPFYAADALGYYRDAGLKVTFHHHSAGEDEFAALVAGKEDMIFAGGDEVLQARGHDVPIVYVAQVFNQYPVALVVPADSPIKSPADLRGHSVGVPGAYGATYIGLLALLEAGGLTPKDVDIQSIGFTQVPALLGHKVDAVMGYLNNEPLQFQKAGFAVRTIPVAESQPLISNGLAALEKQLADHPDEVKAVVAATLKGVEYVSQHPEDAVKLSEKYVPGLNDP